MSEKKMKDIYILGSIESFWQSMSSSKSFHGIAAHEAKGIPQGSFVIKRIHSADCLKEIRLLKDRNCEVLGVFRDEFGARQWGLAWQLSGWLVACVTEPLRGVDLESLLGLLTSSRPHDGHIVGHWEKMTAQVKALSGRMREDLQILSRLQKSFFPEKFPMGGGISFHHRYLAGYQKGGEYLDVVEFDDRDHLGLLMSDSSCHGLSSAFLNTIVRSCFQMSHRDPAGPPSRVLEPILRELRNVMKEEDHFSIFYGIYSKASRRFRYSSIGTVECFVGHGKISKEKAPFRKRDVNHLEDLEVTLNPGQRLTLVSDGFKNFAGGELGMQGLLRRFEGEATKDFVNELSFVAKKALPQKELPQQDCSVLVMDIDQRSGLRVVG